MTSKSTTFYFIFCTILNSTFAISVRLSGWSSTTNYFAYGRVEINYNGTWSTVCDRLWDDDEATVVCKMFGYQYGIAIKNAKYGKGTGPVILDRGYCRPYHKSLDDCSSLSYATNCSHNQDAGIVCNIRLAGTASISTSFAYGRVEVFYNGSWGTVCDSNWGSNEARVVCKMFGYSSGIALTESVFGTGFGPVWLKNVICLSSAKDLSQCNYIGLGNVSSNYPSWYCSYKDDAGVLCYDNSNESQVICGEGWTGSSCLKDIDECQTAPCSHNGTCINSFGSFKCMCPTGWKGSLCEIDIDECENDSCAHNSSCINTLGSYTCLCISGWKGSTCNIDIDECQTAPCSHNGTCINSRGSLKCMCPTGWKGSLCEIDIDECENDSCAHNSSCINTLGSYTCLCISGWKGSTCNIDVDECALDMCANGGKCTNTIGSYHCECRPGFIDSRCTILSDLEGYLNKTESLSPANMAGWILFGILLLILFTVTAVIAKHFKRKKAGFTLSYTRLQDQFHEPSQDELNSNLNSTTNQLESNVSVSMRTAESIALKGNNYQKTGKASSSVSMTMDDMSPVRNTNDNSQHTLPPNEDVMDEAERQMFFRLKEIETRKAQLMAIISKQRRKNELQKGLEKAEEDLAMLEKESMSLQGSIIL